MGGELKRRDDAEVAPSPTHGPEQVGVLGRAGSPQLPVGRHDLHRAQVVAGQPVAAVQPADPPAQRQPGDAGGRDDATGDRQPEGLGLAIDIPPGRPALDAHDTSVGIDPHATHRRQIQHQPVIADAVAGDAMSSSPHRGQQLLLAGQVDRVDDISGARALHDQARAAICQAILDNPGLVIPVVLRRQQPTPKGHPKRHGLLVIQLGGLARKVSQSKRHVPPCPGNRLRLPASLLPRPGDVKDLPTPGVCEAAWPNPLSVVANAVRAGSILQVSPHNTAGVQ